MNFPISNFFPKLVISVTLRQYFGSDLKIFRIEILNASATCTPSKSNQLRNVNTIGWESSNITTKPGENDDRKSKVIAFFVIAGRILN